MKIVIVDESSDTCDMLAYILGDAGHTVYSAQNSSEALPIIHQHSPDIVMIDLNTKGLPIDQFVKAVHAHCPPTEIVAMSGPRTVMMRAMALNIHRYLQKPFEPAQVLKAIEPRTATPEQ